LVGQRTPIGHCRRIVAAPIGSPAVLTWPSNRNAKQGEYENAASKESFDLLFHVRPAIDKTARQYPYPDEPQDDAAVALPGSRVRRAGPPSRPQARSDARPFVDLVLIAGGAQRQGGSDVVRLLRLRSPLRLAPHRPQAHAAKANCATIRLNCSRSTRPCGSRSAASSSPWPHPSPIQREYRIAHARLGAAALTNKKAHSPHTRKRRAANPSGRRRTPEILVKTTSAFEPAAERPRAPKTSLTGCPGCSMRNAG
jgi:hypothetical protein